LVNSFNLYFSKNLAKTFVKGNLIFIILSLLRVFSIAQIPISVCSWNLKDFGKSKTEIALSFIANTVKDYDVIAIQEVVAKDGGAPAVARLVDELNRKGTKWDYTISDITSGSAYKTERYAFIWKTSKLAIIGKAWLEKKYNIEIDREPYFATFKSNGKLFTLVNFHAITKSKQPETEIKYFKFLPAEYPDKNLIFAGDFNCPQTHTVFNPLKAMGYKPIFINQKTSLKQTCINNDCLASEFDNMFYKISKVKYLNSGVIEFYKSFSTPKEARIISDHIPIYFQFTLN
jgi:endonuclease/exonuclease/phosphatase family metal-dependent hydrolase